jgi:DNA polymerase-1
MTADIFESPRKLVLVDGSGYLYRAFHALPPLMSSKGEPTGALHGVVNMINRALKDEQPDYIAVVFDAPGKTFRDELFEQYKAHRPPMPDELRSQIQPLLDIVAGMGLPLLQITGVEADDVIGTLATRAAAQGLRVIISTGDKDMAQLVNDRITLSNTMTNSRLDRQGVKNKFDVFPEQIVEYLALVGDSSDNIPGIPKVGEKTAAKWLNTFGTTTALIENASTIAGREKGAAASLLANLSDLELSKKLATIDCNVTLEMQPTDLKLGAPDQSKLREIYTRFELKSFLKQLDGGASAPQPSGSEPALAAPPVAPTRNAARRYECVMTEEAFAAWLEKLATAELISFDTETTSLNYMQAEIVGVSFSVASDHAAYVPLSHRYPGAPTQLDRSRVLAALKPMLENERIAKVGHHLKYDAHVLMHYGIAMAAIKYDSMLESYVLNSTVTRHDMDSVAKRYLGIETIHYEDVAGKGAKQINFDQVDVERAAEYSAEDADVTLQLHRALWPQLQAIPTLQSVYEQIEQPLVPVLLRMEHTGVLLDSDLLRKQSSELAKRMEEVKNECHRVAEQPFNVDSPKQLQEILFGKLGIPAIRKTPTGQPSTAEDVLEELAEQYELPKLIMEYRGLTKLKSTYTDKLPLQIDSKTGRVHTSYHQAVAATGRLSSQDPNLQNIPIRSAEGRRIRQAFIAPPGYVLLAADYSQIELRIMAHLSGDRSLLTAFAEDRDIHQATAAEVLGVAIEQVTSEQRRSAKAINFGLIYGMSAFGLAKQLGVARGEAQKYVDLYFERYPGVKRYMDETRAQAREQGFVETVFGRRLYLQDINNRNAALRQYAERSAINAPMQGTAADIIKRAMIDVYEWLCQSKSDARLVMQVHDELVLEVGANSVEAVTLELRKRMERAAELRVPLKVEVGVGANWDEAH